MITLLHFLKKFRSLYNCADMRLCKWMILFCFGLTNSIVNAQNTFAFKCRVIHNKKGIMKQFSVLVNDEKATTNDAGIFVLALDNSRTYATVALQQTVYTILYPLGGHVPVPRDLNELPEIIIGSPEDNTYIKAFLSLTKERNAQNNIELRNYLDQKIDSLTHLMLQLNYSQTDLENAKQLQEGKDRYFPEITRILNEFTDRAVNLGIAFRYTSDYAFENSSALLQLSDAITQYNHSFSELSAQRTNYEKFISRYWQDDSLSHYFHSLITYTLDTLHNTKILKLMDIIKQIRDYFTAGNKSKELKQQIQQGIAAFMPSLEEMLARLREMNTQFQKEFSN